QLVGHRFGPGQAWRRRCPGGRVGAGLVAVDGLGGADQGAQGGQIVGGGTESAGLDERVAEGGGFDGAGEDRDAAGVGGELAEQLVAGAAADNVHSVDVAVGQAPRVGEGGPVCQGEAVQDTADGFGGAVRRFLAQPGAFGGDAG